MFSLVFLNSNSWHAKPTLHCTLLTQPSPKLTAKFFFAKKQPCQRDQNVFIMLPSKHKIQPKFSTPSLCFILPTVHFPSPYLLHTPTFLPRYQPTFSRRTSGHCLRTFRAVNVSHPARYNKCGASNCIPVSSSLFFCKASKGQCETG